MRFHTTGCGRINRSSIPKKIMNSTLQRILGANASSQIIVRAALACNDQRRTMAFFIPSDLSNSKDDVAVSVT
jgi:hypothetical protein